MTRPANRRGRPAAGLAVVALVALAACVSCKGADGRAADHVARAQSILASPDGILEIREAAIELRNATALDPENAQAHALLGETLVRLGVTEEATRSLEEAVRLDPANVEYKTGLASALIFSDPDRAAETATAALEADPDSIEARLVLAETDAIAGDYPSAEHRLAEAERIAPEQPDIDWARARVYEAKIRGLRRQRGRTLFDPADFQKASDAYDAYVAKGGSHPSSVLMSKAKLFTVWPGRRSESMAVFREAAAAAADDPAAEIGVLTEMTKAARAQGDAEALRFALERHTELDPSRVDLWEMRVQLAREVGRDPQPILEEMLDEIGDDARAHVVYARALREDQGLSAAVAYLRQRVDAGDEAPVLLAQMVQMQTLGGRPLDASLTLAELEEKHPDDIQTRLILARRALMAGDAAKALEAIETIANETGQPDAARLLARAQERLGRREAALQSIQRAIAASPHFDPNLYEHEAELLRDLGRPAEAMQSIDRIGRAGELTHDQVLIRIECEYDLGRRSIARAHLLDLLEEPDAPGAAALLLYDREGQDETGLALARKALAEARDREPRSYEIIDALVQADMELGHPKLAALTLQAALRERPRDPELYALRARLSLAMGNAKGAGVDSERALMLTPTRGDAALGVQIALAEASPDPARLIETFSKLREAGELKLHRKVILGRLLARAGYGDQALSIFEEALAEGAEFTILKSDTAQLILLLGGDLDRAETLAREAVASPGEQVAAADVLGQVYMARGLSQAAMYQFQFAADHAKPPSPEYLLHLGQALEQMERTDQARAAYARALEIDPRHGASREALGALGDPDAGRADPS